MKNVRRHHTYNIDNELQLLSFVCTREQWEASEELYHYTAHAPHIDGLSVWKDSQHDLWCSIESTLNICVHNFFIESTAAKVSYDDPALIFLFQQNILGFQVTVDDAKSFHVLKTAHELNGKSSNESLLESGIIVHLYEFI